jgi:glycosyltransferase involved in cell wall biosynthesis
LQRAISSVLNQSYSNYELIIVDDGSTDDTENLIHSYGNKIIYKKLEKNFGVNYARNRGYEIAHGNILLFLDSDDELLPKALETIANDFSRHEDISLIAYNCIDSSTGLKTANIEKSSYGIYEAYICGKVKGELFQVIRSDVMINYRFPEFVNGVENLFWFDIWKNYKVYISESALRIYHTETTGSIMKSTSVKRSLTFGLAREKLIQKFGEDVKNNCLNIYAKFLYIIGLELSMGGLKNKGISYFKRSYSTSKNLKVIFALILTKFFGSRFLRFLFSSKKSLSNIQSKIRHSSKKFNKTMPFHLTYLIGNLGAGGAEKLICDLAIGLDKEKFRVSVIALGHYQDKQFEDQRVALLRKNGVEVIIISKKAHGDRLKTILSLRNILKRDQVDLIHTHLFTGMVYGSVATVGMKIPLINTYHNTSGFGKKDRIVSFLFKRKFKLFIGVSESVKGTMKDYFKIPLKKIKVIYNGVDTKKFTNVQSVKKDNKIIFGSIGRLTEAKGFDLLIKAAQEIAKDHEDVYFKIAGDGPLKDSLRKLSSDYGIADKVEFLGNVTDIPSFLSGIDIFVAPSRYEGFGIALVESMAAGKPIIVSNLDVFKEILKIDERSISNYLVTNYGVIFKSQNVQSLVDAIKWMIDNRAQWPEFAKNSRNRAMDFDISKTVSQHEKLYEEILK